MSNGLKKLFVPLFDQFDRVQDLALAEWLGYSRPTRFVWKENPMTKLSQRKTKLSFTTDAEVRYRGRLRAVVRQTGARAAQARTRRPRRQEELAQTGMNTPQHTKEKNMKYMRNGETERAAVELVDNAINRLLDRRTAVTPARVAAQAMTGMGISGRFTGGLVYDKLRQLARSRMNTYFHVRLQARALATVGCKPAAIVAGRTVMQQAA